MSLFIKIIDVHAREILDSRGNPTVEVEVTAETETTGKKITARESVPSGASTGRFEAIELRDGEERYFGLGVRKVVDHVNQKIREKLIGFNVLDQAGIDRIMVEEDGKYYPMMKVIPTEQKGLYAEGVPAAEEELEYGKYLLEKAHPVMGEYLKKELSVNQGVYEKLRVQESERTKERSAEVLHMIKRAEDLLDRYF